MLGLGLAALVLVWPARQEGSGVTLSSEMSVEDVADVLSARVPEPLLYQDSLPPTRGVAALLSGAAQSGWPVTLVTPDGAPTLRVTPPTGATAMRRAALDISLRGVPGETRIVTVSEEAGAIDSIDVQIGTDGTAEVAIAVEPTRQGENDWTVRSGADSLTARVWARPERPVRVLVWTDAPSWESRYLVRALEAAGTTVTVTQDLGRQKQVSSPGASRSLEREALRSFDVVAAFGDQSATSLRDWVVEDGGGLLLIQNPARASQVNPRQLSWGGPVEIVPLPSIDLTLTGHALEVGPAGVAIASQGEEAYVAAEWWGRGRLLTSGLTTWPWALGADHRADHRRYWESVVEWLAGGFGRGAAFLEGPIGQPHVAWTGDLWEAGQPSDTQTGPTQQVRRVPLAAGGLAVLEGQEAGIAVAPNDEPLPWAGAALEVGGAGGRLVSTASPPSRMPSGRVPRWLPWVMFMALASLALLGWAARRVTGRS